MYILSAFLNWQCLFFFIKGDFFNDPIPEADLFIMARIIHDWTEEKCLELLRKIYRSCKDGEFIICREITLDTIKIGLSSELEEKI